MATASHFAGAVRCKLPGLKVSSYSAQKRQSLRLPAAITAHRRRSSKETQVYCRLMLAIALAGAVLSPPARAEGEQSLRLLWAKSSEADLATVVIGDYDPPESNYLLDRKSVV